MTLIICGSETGFNTALGQLIPLAGPRTGAVCPSPRADEQPGNETGWALANNPSISMAIWLGSYT